MHSYISRSPKNYSTSTTFTCQPRRWAFVCKSGNNGNGQASITVMATFDLEETMQISTYISQKYESSECALYTVCRKCFAHVSLAAGGIGRSTVRSMYKWLCNRNVSDGNGCCSFSHDAEAGKTLSQSLGACWYFSYIHPLAIEAEKCWISSNQSSASALARPKICTTKCWFAFVWYWNLQGALNFTIFL